MNTKAILTILLLTPVLTTSATDFETATSAVANMRVGWNLGNTLDSNSGDINNMWIEKWTSRRPADYETAWGQPITKPQLFQMFKQAGFNAIRLPVTWYPHMQAHFTLNGTAWDPENDDIGTKIQTQWMTRVHQIVDYVINQGMYCILNIHHDTGAANTAWLVASENDYAQQKERFEEVWRQIAEEFKDYDQHLIFEAYNEMLDPHHSWCFASFAASSLVTHSGEASASRERRSLGVVKAAAPEAVSDCTCGTLLLSAFPGALHPESAAAETMNNATETPAIIFLIIVIILLLLHILPTPRARSGKPSAHSRNTSFPREHPSSSENGAPAPMLPTTIIATTCLPSPAISYSRPRPATLQHFIGWDFQTEHTAASLNSTRPT